MKTSQDGRFLFWGFFWVGKQTKQKKSAQNESVFIILGELTL